MRTMKKLYIIFAAACQFSFLGTLTLEAQNPAPPASASTTADIKSSGSDKNIPVQSDASDDVLARLYAPGGIYRNFKPEQEDLSKRDEFTKHFLNPDSSYTAILTSGPSHYWENGGWRTASLAISPTGDFKYP